MIDEVVASYVAGATAEGFPEEWDLDRLWRAFRQLYPVGMTVNQLIDEAGGEKSGLSGEMITEYVREDARAAYQHRTEELGEELMREFERRVVLSVLDRKWREHLYEMDYLREGIGLRGWAQRDPLVEYQREGYDMFNTMMDGIKEESVGSLFNLQVEVQQDPIVAEGDEAARGTGRGRRGLPGARHASRPRRQRRRPACPGRGALGQAAPGQAVHDRRGQGGSGRAGSAQGGSGQGGSGQGGSGSGRPGQGQSPGPGRLRSSGPGPGRLRSWPACGGTGRPGRG